MNPMKNIKRSIFIYVISVLFIICASGCRKASHNGKLDGQWQIMKIENLETSEEKVPEGRRYICLNLHVVQLEGMDVSKQAVGNMAYDKDAGIINWDFPYNTAGDDLKRLEKWGIYTNPVEIKVLKVDGSALVLRTPETIITCRRF